MTSHISALKLHPSWQAGLAGELAQPYFQDLKRFLLAERATYQVFPPGSLWFAALNETPLSQVKVVILGQDPYHNQGQAHGLCFSVRPGVAIPPSLKNIFQELQQDLGIEPPDHGCLLPWARNGVLLLNTVLTVRAHHPLSHRGQGWEQFTNKILSVIDQATDHVVFMLWGKEAQQKSQWINTSKHLVLSAAHPSPFSAHRGYLGCKHFSQANQQLVKWNKEPINWQLPHLAE